MLLNVFDALAEADADNLVYEFGSTAKVTFPSSGIAFVAAGDEDITSKIGRASCRERV